MTNNYELLYIISSQFTDDEAKSVQTEIDELLKKNNSQIGYQKSLGKKRLAYPIKGSLHGHYLLTEFELEKNENLKTINTALKLDKRLLRAQIINKPKITKTEIARLEKQQTPFKEVPREEIRVKPEKEEREPTAKPSREKKVSIENLDEKLDEILKEDIM